VAGPPAGHGARCGGVWGWHVDRKLIKEAQMYLLVIATLISPAKPSAQIEIDGFVFATMAECRNHGIMWVATLPSTAYACFNVENPASSLLPRRSHS
jgi:hypothetical protein